MPKKIKEIRVIGDKDCNHCQDADKYLRDKKNYRFIKVDSEEGIKIAKKYATKDGIDIPIIEIEKCSKTACSTDKIIGFDRNKIKKKLR